MKRAYQEYVEDGCVAAAHAGALMDVDGASQQPHAASTTCGTQERLVRKRACGRASLGAMPGNEVALHAARLGLIVPTVSGGGGGGGSNSEQCAALAELNALIEAHPGEIGGNSLSFCSVPRTSRINLWTRYARTHGLTPEAAHAAAVGCGGGAPLPGMLGVALHIIGTCLAPYPDASVTEYVVRMPGWLLGWAARWGLGSACGANVTLLHVEAYANNTSFGTAPAKPVRSLYLPVLPC